MGENHQDNRRMSTRESSQTRSSTTETKTRSEDRSEGKVSNKREKGKGTAEDLLEGEKVWVLAPEGNNWKKGTGVFGAVIIDPTTRKVKYCESGDFEENVEEERIRKGREKPKPWGLTVKKRKNITIFKTDPSPKTTTTEAERRELLPHAEEAQPLKGNWKEHHVGPEWLDTDIKHIEPAVQKAYEGTGAFKANLFELPTGETGKGYLEELNLWLSRVALKTSYERIAMKIVMIMPHLLLQRPAMRTPKRMVTETLNRRMRLWRKGEIGELLEEAKRIQKENKRHLERKEKEEDEKVRQSFVQYMQRGDVNQASKCLGQGTIKGGVLPITTETIQELEKKHPKDEQAQREILIAEKGEVDTGYFEVIDENFVKKIVSQLKGASGPSGANSHAWRRWCLAYKGTSDKLCRTVATLARRLATDQVAFEIIEALVRGRLLPLDKCPGVRPVGVGEVLRRLLSKIVASRCRNEIQETAGHLQLCAGQPAGCEAAAKTMIDLWRRPEVEMILLVDADNAFNRLNRTVTLNNMYHTCTPLATYCTNTYREKSKLMLPDGKWLWSREGTTQGDPMAMIMYGMGILPLIHSLQDDNGTRKQVWYADDAAAAGTVSAVRSWWEALKEKGPAYGYFPNQGKTWAIVKKEKVQQAQEALDGIEVDIYDEEEYRQKMKSPKLKITTQGQRYLGAGLGTEKYQKYYLQKKIRGWVVELERLSDMATTNPHEAYCCLVRSMVAKWRYAMRLMGGETEDFRELDKTIDEKLLPSLLDRHLHTQEREIFALPTRKGGLAIPIPSRLAEKEKRASDIMTEEMKEKILSQEKTFTFNEQAHKKWAKELRQEKEERAHETWLGIWGTLKDRRLRSFEDASRQGSSVWLTTLPLKEDHFCLSKQEFRDAINIRYGITHGLGERCPACDIPFDLSHALKCHTGGHVKRRHNEVRDELVDIAKKLNTEVQSEPDLLPITKEHFTYRSTKTKENAKPDIMIRGLFQEQQGAYTDVKVFDPAAPSYLGTELETLYKSQERKKTLFYAERIKKVDHGDFFPAVFSVGGGIGPEADKALSHIADRLAAKEKTKKSVMKYFLKLRIQYAIIRGVVRCLRGRREKKFRERREYRDVDAASLIVEDSGVLRNENGRVIPERNNQ